MYGNISGRLNYKFDHPVTSITVQPLILKDKKINYDDLLMFRKLSNKLCLGKFLLLLIFILLYSASFSQKYNFINYSVEQGLAQAQPGSIIQDKYGMIWIATFGGISRFDGQTFYNYYKKDGLKSQFIYTLYSGKDDRIWLGMQDGIQSFDGREFKTYSFPSGIKSNAVVNIRSDEAGHIFAHVASGNLLSIQETGQGDFIKNFEESVITTIATDKHNIVFAAVYKKGIYQLIKDKWEPIPNVMRQLDTGIIIQQIYFDAGNKIWLLTNNGVYTDIHGSLVNIIPHDRIKSNLLSIAEDSKERIWIGTSKGAYIIGKENEIEYVGAASGLTDNTVYSIIKDREGNLWFATDGDGIYKLTNGPLVYYNSTQGLNGNIVMGIVKDSAGNIWVGTSEEGLSKYDGHKFTRFPISSSRAESQKTNCLFYDSNKRLWIGTLGGGLWIWQNGKFTEVLTEKGNHFREIASIYEDSQKTIWATMSFGVYYYAKGTMHKVSAITQPCFSVIEKGKDTILIGASSGLLQLVDKSKLSLIDMPQKKITSVSCFTKWENYILLGTGDDGIIFWDPHTNKTLQCSSKDGLSSDFIFSLYNDGSNNIFTGTGHGVSKIVLNEETKSFTVKNYFSFNNPYGPECNLNVVQKSDDGKIWFGTTRGIVVYNPADSIETTTAPLIYLKSVDLFSKKISTSIAKDSIQVWNNIPYNMKLSHLQNHLTFEFTGLYFSNPSSIKYRYKLEGADTAYSNLITIPKVIYSNLRPGKYSFKAFAVTDNGTVSSNSINFRFTIEAPFYQQFWFKLIIVLVLIGSGVLIQHGRNQLKAKRAATIDKIRKEEQQKIQERTSEDLHDDLGNKITRISVLADILQNKIDKEDTEKKKLVTQIKENARLIYLGTKDIIWSLTPGNDNLYDVLERCRVFGVHLFEDTNIEFVTEGLHEQLKEIKIPLAVSRNLVMIIQEALNNILKHSDASKALFSIACEKKSDLFVIISDNGRGMNNAVAGNGLGNIQKRLSRIGGSIIMNTNKPGLELKISLKIPQMEG